MKRGDKVFVARVSDGAPELEQVEVVSVISSIANLLFPGGRLGFVALRDLHATRTAALEALAERLEQEAQRERTVASEHITRAERCLIQAGQARRMVDGGGK